MGDESTIDVLSQLIDVDKQNLIDNKLQKMEVDSFNLSEFWIQFGLSVKSLSKEVTKVHFLCGSKPFPDSEMVDWLTKQLMQHYIEIRDVFFVLPEEVGSLVYKSAMNAIENIMSSLSSIVKTLKDISEAGANERLMLARTFWDVCNAVDKLPRNNLQACIVAVDAEQSLVNDAVEELNQVKESDSLENDTNPKIAANVETDQPCDLTSDSDTEEPINIYLSPKINKTEKTKKGLRHKYSKAKFFKNRFKKRLARTNLLNRKAGNGTYNNKRTITVKSDRNASDNIKNEESDTEQAKPDSTEYIPELDPDIARTSRRASDECDNQISSCSNVEDHKVSTYVNAEGKRIRTRIIAGTDYINLGTWVRVLKIRKICLDATTVPGKFDEIIRVLQNVADNWDDFVKLKSSFEGLNANQIMEKELLLLTRLDDFKTMKFILETDPRPLKLLFPDSDVREQPSTSKISNESEENVVSSSSDCTPPTHNPGERSFDQDSGNCVTSSETNAH